MLSKNKEYVVDIVDIGQGGVGIGKYEGFTVFVEGGLIQDKVKVRINKSKKNYAVGDIVEIIEKSPFRVDRICSDDLKDCGGCQIQELDYNKQLELKTNEVKQVISRRGDDVKRSIISYRLENVSIYNETTHTGVLRHLVTKVGFTTNEVMVVLVANGTNLPHLNELASVLKENIPGFKTLVLNVNKAKTNVILGKENKVIYGNGKINDYIGDLVFEISPLSFFQVNPVQTEVLYNKALEYAELKENDTVFDIYCGIGSISLFLAQKATKVYGIEIVEDAIKDAKINAKLNNLNNVEFYVGKAEEVVPKMYSEGKTANVVVVDPPRKGCDEKVLDTIVSMKPDRVVYVSCNPSTLARDLAYLDERGYKCVEIQPVDMFPHTMHVECCAKIVKKSDL